MLIQPIPSHLDSPLRIVVPQGVIHAADHAFIVLLALMLIQPIQVGRDWLDQHTGEPDYETVVQQSELYQKLYLIYRCLLYTSRCV